MWWRCYARLCSVLRLQQIYKPMCRSVTPAYCQQTTCQDSNHIMEKTIRLDVNGNDVAIAPDIKLFQEPNSMICLTL